MSFDLSLPTVCNHTIYKELVDLGEDHRTLRLAQPMAASNVKVYASNDLVPSSLYSIEYDPETITINQPRVIIFNDPWQQIEDYFEVTYVTLKGFCNKCAGLEYLDDISYDVRGGLSLNRNEYLLLQNLEKFTVTEKVSNPFHTFIGTTLVKLLGQKITDPTFISSRITQEINTTLAILKSLQDQYKSTGRNITDGERLDAVENVKVRFDEEDPSIIRVDVTARAVSGRSVDYSQYLKIG
jgi:hypothetical protein